MKTKNFNFVAYVVTSLLSCYFNCFLKFDNLEEI